MSTENFVHLHLHTQYSLLDGAIRVKDLIPKVKEYGMNAVAITDHGNMFGIADFYKTAIAAGIKPILGCEAYVAAKDRRDKTSRASHHLILLARTQDGYDNLKYLVSMGYAEGFYYRPRIDKELLSKYSKGLIACSACLGGEVARAFTNGNYEKAKQAAKSLADCMEPGMFFLEVQNNGYDGQKEYNDALRKIGQELNIPLVATNDCHYLTSDDARAHTVLMCIGQGSTLEESKGKLHYTDELYLRTAEEMSAVMQHFPDAMENTVKIAEMCENVVPTRNIELPDYKIPEGMKLDEYLRKTSHDMLNERFEEFKLVGKDVDTTVYRKRLDIELDVICEMGFPGYFLIVMDFINWAKEHDIPVGPGRGSGAGSLVAYALKITNLDPIPLNLLFERFLNPERVSMPDFDVDFCKNKREQVIQYVIHKYGEDNVGQIATFHQLKSRSVVRDVGRVMALPYGDVDKIAKLVPEGPKVTLAKALEEEEKLRDARKEDRQIDQLLTYAERLENLNRHAGMHAAGVVIGNKPLWAYVPVFTAGDRSAGNPLVSQFDMGHVETCGLVKFDFLGLKTLTVIDTALKLVAKRPDVSEPTNIDAIDLDVQGVYDMISRGDTWGVFQLESSGFQELLKKLKPDCFEDIIAAVALYRPGPLEGGMVDTFVECKHGRQEIVYPHNSLEKILKETYGVIVYQEQVMQSAQILAGYSLGAADIMRRAMGKKKVEEMVKQRNIFVAGCEKNDIPASKANEIFDLIDKFAGYGFNKSHSAAYALVTYQTAWLKYHYPAEFLAALLTCDRENTEKIAEYIRLGKKRNIGILQPDINHSEIDFSVLYRGQNGDMQEDILFGLGAIKGVGDAALKSIIETREDGPYADIFDFAMRVDLSKVNKGVFESLTKAGAFDVTIKDSGVNRGQVFGVIERALERGKSEQKDRESGQTSLFGALAAAPGNSSGANVVEEVNYDGAFPWSERELLSFEKASVGFFMSGHPMERYEKEASRLTGNSTQSLSTKKDGEEVTIAGIMMEYGERKTKSGKRIGLGAIEDLVGRANVIVFPKNLEHNSQALHSSEPLLIKGRVLVDERGESEERKIAVSEATLLHEVRTKRTKEVHLHIDSDIFPMTEMEKFKTILSRHMGRCDAFLEIRTSGAVTTMNLPEEYRLSPSDELLYDLSAFTGVKEIMFK
ncbi:MAG: DNA polymerase III subunit alpha [Deltaproteobacteria bacterium]|nr:DNA polymerase III subunit alpha [Deltaproteobacteria bacterium]